MTHDMRIEWGRRLRRLRKQAGLSLKDVTERAAISKAHYCRIETGEVGTSDEVKVRIAAALGVRVEDIWAYPAPERQAS